MNDRPDDGGSTGIFVKLRGVVVREVEFVRLTSNKRCSNSVSLPGFLVLECFLYLPVPVFFVVAYLDTLRKSLT
jgi:hypothetical protein